MKLFTVPKHKLPALGKRTQVDWDGEPIAIYHTDTGFHAMDDLCAHMDAALSEGCLEGYRIICPLHAWEYDIRTGKCVAPTWGKMNKDVAYYPSKLEQDGLTLYLPKPKEDLLP